ncbi:MAG: hypothetical protein COC01_07880 [Bacteroidetes bacterium]|nr:MAG: hypothetical protein COC01_07880 [Bacteroidota bacterium]
MKIFKLPIFILIIYFSDINYSYSQEQAKVDSLRNILSHTIADSTRVNTLAKLAWYYSNENPDSAIIFAESALELAIKSGYKKGEATAYFYCGLAQRYAGNLTEAITSYQNGLELSAVLKDTFRLVQCLNNIGIIYDDRGDYDRALSYYLKSLKMKELINDSLGIASSLNNVALIYEMQKNHIKALEYYDRSLNIVIDLGHKKGEALLLSNIGLIYHDKQEFDKALEYFNRSLNISKEINNKTRISYAYMNIGIIYYYENKYDSALFYYDKSIFLQKQVDDKFNLSTSYRYKGETYLAKRKFSKALIFLNQSMDLAKVVGANGHLRESYLLLSKTYAAVNDSQSAYKNHKLYTAIKDSMFNEQSTRSMQEMQTKYESEKKEKEIEMLTKDNELQALKTSQQESQIKKQRYLMLGIVFILVLAISLIYIVYSQFRFKKLANYELEFKNDMLKMINHDLDRKNRNIAESINYAQRIQETIMPTQNHLTKIFPESFIYYKAKDVVSGDFPWLMQIDKYIFTAAIDCTGHGIPGAMMSMIGYFLLNDIVGDRKIHNPAIILEELHNGIKQTLKQDENLESNDGLDIAFCTINKEEREVQYAGAHRPLIWLHQGKIEEIRGDRLPIGGLQYSNRGKEIKFTNHKLKLNKGDSIYFYSDGLTDQIGGPKGRKFQNKQVQEIILSNQDKSMDELKDVFNDQFIKWMGSEKQLDDVIMMGIKV